MKRYGKYLLVFIVVLFCQPSAVRAGGQPAKAYKFGVFPYLSAVLLDDIYAPAGTELGKQLGRQVLFRTSSNFKLFFKKLEQQYYDFALIQPFWYPPAVDHFGYQPLVRMVEPFTAQIMVIDDSPLHKVADLKGRIIATPPPFVPVVHMATRALAQAGLAPGRDVKLQSFKTVDSCFQQLLIRAADACISPPFAPPVIEEKMHVRLRVLLETSAIPNLSLVAHSRVPAADREAVKQALLSWHNNDTGKRLLKAMKTRQFVPAVDSDYDVVRTFIAELKAQQK